MYDCNILLYLGSTEACSPRIHVATSIGSQGDRAKEGRRSCKANSKGNRAKESRDRRHSAILLGKAWLRFLF